MPTANIPVARTPLHHWHAADGARFIERDGWQVVAAYASPEREVEAARTGLAVADISSFAEVSPQAGFWILGPRWDELLRRLTQLDLRPESFPINTRVETALAGVEALLVRSEESSVSAVRIHVAWDVAEYVWERMLEAGQDVGITPIGMDALARLLNHRA